MEWFNQLRFSLFRLNNFCDRCTNPVSRNLFWDWRDPETFAEDEDAEDLFEDSLSEVLEEISPHVEEKKEDKSAGEEEERENMSDDKEEEKELTTFSNAKEKEEVVTKVHGMFNFAPPSKDLKKTMRSQSLATTYPLRSSSRRMGQLLPQGPAALKKNSSIKVVSLTELPRTRYQEKMAMEEVKEERKKVPQFGLIKPSTPKRKRTFKVEEMNVRLKKMRIGK